LLYETEYSWRLALFHRALHAKARSTNAPVNNKESGKISHVLGVCRSGVPLAYCVGVVSSFGPLVIASDLPPLEANTSINLIAINTGSFFRNGVRVNTNAEGSGAIANGDVRRFVLLRVQSSVAILGPRDRHVTTLITFARRPCDSDIIDGSASVIGRCLIIHIAESERIGFVTDRIFDATKSFFLTNTNVVILVSKMVVGGIVEVEGFNHSSQAGLILEATFGFPVTGAAWNLRNFDFPLSIVRGSSEGKVERSGITSRSAHVHIHVLTAILSADLGIRIAVRRSDGELIETTTAGIGGMGAGGIGRGLNGVSGSLDGESFEVQSQRANV